MILFTFIKLILLFVVVYFLMILVRMLFFVGRNLNRRERIKPDSSKNRQEQNTQNTSKQTIELDKDQYKVE